MRAFVRGLVIVGMGIALPFSVERAWGQQCDDFDQCTVQDSCQVDGNCRGTPLANGTSCDDQNPCTLNDRCLGGVCIGTMAPTGTACTSPSFGECMTDATCVFGFCLGDFVECPDDGNLCTFEFCNPASGLCEKFDNNCQQECASGQCDAGTGECINIQNKPNGTSCDDSNECTNVDFCQNGECEGSVGLFATPTPTVTGVQQPTVTRTPTLVPTLSPTLSPTVVVMVATSTPTHTAAPTMTPTVGPSFTATPTLPPVEEVDVNCDDRISAPDATALVALLSSSDPQPCGAFDVNRDGTEDGEDLRALIRFIFALG